MLIWIDPDGVENAAFLVLKPDDNYPEPYKRRIEEANAHMAEVHKRTIRAAPLAWINA